MDESEAQYYGEEDEEEMPVTERDLADDAQWKLIQKNTFSRWANEHLKTVNKNINDLETDLADGLRLIGLVEVLSGKKFKHINKRPNFRTQKLENVTMVLKFLEEDEGIKIVNIDSTDIVDGKLKLILGLIWTLILHYSISMPMWEGEEPGPQEGGPTPKQRLLNWVQSKCPDIPIKNFSTDWNDGKAISALVDAVAPGLMPDWDQQDPKNRKKNAKEALDNAEKWLDIPQLIKPEEMTNPKVDEMSMMTYLSQFPKAKLKPGAPLRPRLNPSRVRAYGPGLEPKGNQVGAPARFTVETFSAGKGTLEVMVLNPKGQKEPSECNFNNDKNLTYSCCYTPKAEGQYKVIIKFGAKEIPKSPYTVAVEGAAGDASKVTASGPGIQKSGVIVGKRTHFEVFTKNAGGTKVVGKDAGKGQVEIVIVDVHGRKDTVRPSISPVPGKEGTYLVEYVPIEAGMHSVNVYFAGQQIPKSPFGVGVAPASNAKVCFATGRGIQPHGLRVSENAEFKVHTKGAGTAEVKVQIFGPGGVELKCTVTKSKTEEGVYNCVYVPPKMGQYIINITFGEEHINKSPFKVDVKPQKTSKIRAFGPGLEGGVVNQPATFTVETNGETGALGFSIEGPSHAKIDCRDVGDGSADVTYYPTAPGEYAVHVLCQEEDIPKSPFMVEIQPATKQFDASKVTAKGPGLEKTGVIPNKFAEFTVDAKKAGKAPLKITCLDVDLKPVDVQITDKKDGTYACKYMPKRVCKHTVTITWGGVQIPNSPFRVQVGETAKPGNVKVYGPGVEKGVKTQKKTHFVVDCKTAGPGDISIALVDANGKDVPCKTTDNKDGTFTIEYEPKTPGTYTVSIFFANKEIPISPIKVKVESSIDLSKVKVVGLETPMKVNEERPVEIITKDAGKSDTPAVMSVMSPTNKKKNVPVKESPNGYKANLKLTEPGPHKVNVSYAGKEVPDSPYTVNVVPDISSKVKAYGPGLKGGKAHQPCKFTVDTREATAPGELGVTVEGPKEAKIDCVDNGNGTCDFSYVPEVEGDYKVNVTYANQPIPGSPFKAKVEPGPKINLSGVKAYGPGLSPKGVFLDSATDFTVDAKSVSPVGTGTVRSILTSPTGVKHDTIVTNNKDGTYNVLYTPVEQGPMTIDVTYDNMHIPNSPFKVNAVPGCDVSKVKAYGPGLEGGLTNEPAQFTVDVKGAGQGGLGLNIDGPVEAQINCQDNRDGTCTVDYLPTKPGDYSVDIKFAEQPIPGSPFRVGIKNPVNPAKVQCYGPGLDSKGVREGAPATFTVDTTEAGEAPLEVTYTDQQGNTQPAELVPVAEGKINATYFPREEGKCKVDVKYADKPVPGSPFPMRVLPTADASRVVVTGPGVAKNVSASKPVTFTIDTTEAGEADLDVTVMRPDGSYIQPYVQDNGDGTFTVSYVPDDLGLYKISVKFGGKSVPNAPFRVTSQPTGDASKCVITDGLDNKCVPIKKETVITVDASQAGDGKVTCRIRSPSGSDIDIDIVENQDGTFSLMFTPQVAGAYTISIKFGGQAVPDGEYDIQAVEPDQYEDYLQSQVGQVAEDFITQDTVDSVHAAAPGAGLFQPVDFHIPVGPIFNFVSAHVIMPNGQKAYPKIEDNKDGTVTVRYQPVDTGLHELHVNYNSAPIEGSPFKFHVDAVNCGHVTAYGPGLSHGIINEPAEFTIVTKDAGAGGLSLAIEGPSKTEIKCVDNGNGTCTVSYIPTVPGEYKITCKFADQHISGSPFTAKITPPVGGNKKAQIGRSSEVSLNIVETDISNLTATIKSPSGGEEGCLLKRLPNGHLGISFTPHECGQHLVSVFRNNEHINGSPFPIDVTETELGNASKVRVGGPGLEQAMANEVNEFMVDTSKAGYGGLSLSIEGPSKADIECLDNEDGSCRVTYKPTEPGNYIINIKFADEHVPGSPFMVKVGGESTSKMTERITRHREAADVTHIGSQCELSLKIPVSYLARVAGYRVVQTAVSKGTSPFDMTASVTSPSGTTELCDIISLDDNHYSIKFVPKEMGVHTVCVKHKDMHIPGSPFEFTVGPIAGGGSHKVHAAGPGLEKGEINQPCEFNIYTREAGAGGLSIAVEGPSKAELDFDDRKDGSCGVSYTVTEPGEYLVSIKFNDEHIPQSPYRVYVTPSIGDARKLSVSALQTKGVAINKPVAFVVHFNGAQKGKLKARVVPPSGAEDEAVITEIEEGEYAVRFIPRENGPHMVFVSFDSCEIPESPFRIMIGKVDADPGMVKVTGDGLRTGRTGEPAKFFVNTCNAGSGALAVSVEGPSKVKLDCKETEEGYEFTYNPTAPGDYLISIRYAGVYVAGSPFKAKIEGPGQPSGISEQSSCVVETVTKTSVMSKFTGIQKFESIADNVTCDGNGMKKAFRGKQCTFNVDCSMAGHNMLFVGMIGPRGPCEELCVKHQGNNIFKINYIVKEAGDYMLIVKWGNDHIPGSPFCVKVA